MIRRNTCLSILAMFVVLCGGCPVLRAAADADKTEHLVKLDEKPAWKVIQVYPGLSATVRLETLPATDALQTFTRLVVLRGNRLMGFVRVVGPSPGGCTVGSVGRTMRVASIRHGDVLRKFTLETEPLRAWEQLPPSEQARVTNLVARLSETAYEAREAATRELTSMGRDILPRLREACRSKDPEVRARASEIGFAIAAKERVVPRELAAVLVRQSGRDKPPHQQGFLGVSIADVRQGREPGALITQVLKDSPAARAGIRLQDVIVSIDRQVLDDSTDVLEIISARLPGQQVKLLIRRADAVVTTNATLAARPIPLP